MGSAIDPIKSWQVATCTVSLRAPATVIDAAAPLFALYPSTEAAATIAFEVTPTASHRWQLCCNHEPLWEDEECGNIVAALELALYRRVVSAIAPRLCSIHAAAVVVDGGAILCAGASGAGKSSLCTQALLDGARYCSDEFALLAKDGTIHPFPRPLQWEHLDHPAFSHATMQQSGKFDRGAYRFLQPDGTPRVSQLWLPRQRQQCPTPLKLIVLPQFVADSPTILTPVARSSAMIQLANLLHQRNPMQHNIRLLHQRIPADCRLYTMRFGSARDGWHAIAALLS